MVSMIKLCAALGVFLCAVCVQAATLKIPSLTVGSVTYSNVTVLGANATDLYFTHDHGIGNVKLKYLSPSLQKQFHYDPRVAADEEKKQAEADAVYHSLMASNIAAQVQRERARAETNGFSAALADPISDKSLLGKPAPRLELAKFSGEKPEIEGKFVLLAFWEPWSKPSCESIKELNTLKKKFADRLVVVGVTTNSEAEISQLKDPKPDFTNATDEGQKLATAAGVTSIPSVLLVDASGVVRYQGHPAALSEKKLDALLKPAE